MRATAGSMRGAATSPTLSVGEGGELVVKHIHVPEKHQSVKPTPGVFLAFGIIAVMLVVIYIVVSLAGNPQA